MGNAGASPELRELMGKRSALTAADALIQTIEGEQYQQAEDVIESLRGHVEKARIAAMEAEDDG